MTRRRCASCAVCRATTWWVAVMRAIVHVTVWVDMRLGMPEHVVLGSMQSRVCSGQPFVHSARHSTAPSPSHALLTLTTLCQQVTPEVIRELDHSTKSRGTPGAAGPAAAGAGPAGRATGAAAMVAKSQVS